jgi:hypothetical protein
MRDAFKITVRHFFGLAVLALLAIVLSVPGCTKTKKGSTGIDQPMNMALPEVHELYFAYQKAENKPPAKLADFDKMKQAWPRGYKAVQSGDVVVIWGVALETDKPVAYEKGTPEKGGLVLFGSGMTKNLTPEEFTAAKN